MAVNRIEAMKALERLGRRAMRNDPDIPLVVEFVQELLSERSIARFDRKLYMRAYMRKYRDRKLREKRDGQS